MGKPKNTSIKLATVFRALLTGALNGESLGHIAFKRLGIRNESFEQLVEAGGDVVLLALQEVLTSTNADQATSEERRGGLDVVSDV